MSPGLVDLGTVAVGAEADATVTLSASGGEVRIDTIDVLNVDGDYFTFVGEAGTTLGGDETVDVLVHYSPTEAGFHWAKVTVYTDEEGGGAHELNVRAEAAPASARIYPSILDLGPVRRTTNATGTLTIVNDGRVDLALGAATSSNPSFTVTDTLPLDVPAGENRTVTVSFLAVDESEQTGLATLDLGAWVSVGDVTLRANACSTAPGDLYDQDGDGFSFCVSDCDDWAADTNPAGVETCDGTDQDCDGAIDEGTSCVDDDGDGYSEDDGDCNDGDPAMSPGQLEIAGNGLDDDCDGVTDDGTVDFDGDGYGTSAGDCDDTDASVYPGAPETIDGDDDDCDGIADEGTLAYDDDGDGYTELDGDCDDSDAGAAPGLAETADWTDNDCDGDVDEGTTYGDDDHDGYTEVGGDCDDTNASVNPGQPEVTGNGLDDDCDGVTR